MKKFLLLLIACAANQAVQAQPRDGSTHIFEISACGGNTKCAYDKQTLSVNGQYYNFTSSLSGKTQTIKLGQTIHLGEANLTLSKTKNAIISSLVGTSLQTGIRYKYTSTYIFNSDGTCRSIDFYVYYSQAITDPGFKFMGCKTKINGPSTDNNANAKETDKTVGATNASSCPEIKHRPKERYNPYLADIYNTCTFPISVVIRTCDMAINGKRECSDKSSILTPKVKQFYPEQSFGIRPQIISVRPARP